MMNQIVLGGGCFWCTEAIYIRVKGVDRVMPGYVGGNVANPTYEQVSSGQTQHAEVIKISFNPKLVILQTLLDVFWHIHDPTTLNRQGNDVGDQYRSVIFYYTEQQRRIANYSLKTYRK